MIYDLECSYCGLESEHTMLMDEMDKEVDCPHCGEKLSRRNNRIYSIPMIQGDTVAGGCHYGGYYDVGLGEYVTGRAHRKELMKQKNLVEYSPDPEMKKHRDEAKHISKHSRKSDPDARAAILKEYKTAYDKRRNRNVKESLDKSLAKL